MSFNDSRFQNDVTSGGITYGLDNKKVPNFPALMYKARLGYTRGPFNIFIDTMYEGKRFLSYDNDTWVDPYWLTNVGVEYRLAVPHTKGVTLSFNIYNLTNTVYVSNMGEEGNPLSGDYQSIQIGSPREFFGAISTAF